MANSSEKKVSSGNLELWTESFGDSSHLAVLLIMGAWNQGIVWPDEFCTEIAEHGYYVIRYDHRDTGQSSSVDFPTAPYDLDALTRDAVAVLDGYGAAKAHIVGMSMGGFLAQLLALDHPDRVLTLTLLMTSPDQGVAVAAIQGNGTSQFSLPPPSARLLEHFARMRQSPPRSGEEAFQNAVESWRLANGEGVPFDEPWTRRLLERTWARTRSLSSTNHTLAMAASPGRTQRLGQITAPTLVIHGERDPSPIHERPVDRAEVRDHMLPVDLRNPAMVMTDRGILQANPGIGAAADNDRQLGEAGIAIGHLVVEADKTGLHQRSPGSNGVSLHKRPTSGVGV